MESGESVYDILHRLYDKHGYHPDVVTIDLLKNEVGLTVEQRQLLYPLVRDRVQHALRSYARADSYPVGSQGRRAHVTRVIRQKRKPGDAANDPLWFLECLVPVPGAANGAKKYGDLTVPELQERVFRIWGPQRDAAQAHLTQDETAIRLIAGDKKAKCLHDVSPAKVAAAFPAAKVVFP